MSAGPDRRAALRLVPTTTEVERPGVWFCGHCGAAPAGGTPAPVSRVCGDCGLGLLLEARDDVAPDLGAPFVIADASLCVCAVSRSAEGLLGVGEQDAVGRPLTELVAPADAEPEAQRNLAMLVAWSARGEDEPSHTVVRPINVFGVRFKVRVGACGPPRAALIVLE